MASILPKILRRKFAPGGKQKKSAKSPRPLTRSAAIPAKEDLGGKAVGEKKTARTQKLGDSDIAFKVLVRPRVTEKTTDLSQTGVYTFDVFERTNKVLIKKAVEELYGVKVKKVNLAHMPPKPKLVRGKRGARPGYKKAMVYLKEGDKIEFI